jgi:leader peptidase (prepilin peptidase) / N-methyltransferase
MFYAALPPWAGLVFVTALGLCLGSFATALAWRLPRGLPWVRARSACPSCGSLLSLADLVPVFSWLFLRGACRHCGKKIGGHYFAIEMATMGLCMALYLKYGFSWTILPVFLLPPVLVAAIDIDLRHKIIPDILNAVIAAAAVVTILLQMSSLSLFFTALGQEWMWEGVAGAVLYGGGSYALRGFFLWKMGREALGLGDVKLFAAIGLWFGLDADMLSAFLLLSGAGGVSSALVWRRIAKEAEFPFGPAIIFSFICVLLWRIPYFMS